MTNYYEDNSDLYLWRHKEGKTHMNWEREINGADVLKKVFTKKLDWCEGTWGYFTNSATVCNKEQGSWKDEGVFLYIHKVMHD